MKKRNIILFSILALSLLLLTACETEKKTSTSSVFIGGTKGVSIGFEDFGVTENNVYTIYDNEEFPIEVMLNNKGEYDVKVGDAEVSLMGPSQAEFSGISSWKLKNLAKIDMTSTLLTTGGEETISFGKKVKYLGSVTGSQQRTWFANIDYNYETYLIVPEVCLKEDFTDKRVCTVSEKKTFHISGAPVTVKSVEESTAGKGIMALKIKVSNAGSGKVTKQGSDFGTREELTYTIDDSNWECKSGGRVGEARLIKDEAEILCKLKTALAKDTLATKQVKLTFKYKYRDLIQEKLVIKESS